MGSHPNHVADCLMISLFYVHVTRLVILGFLSLTPKISVENKISIGLGVDPNHAIVR